MPNKLFTLVYALRDDKVLLGMKKRGFGAGKWNGFGGKVSKEETLEEAALREMTEETGVTPVTLLKVGVLEFEFVDNPQILETHVFKTPDLPGEPTETEEMRPEWYKLSEIPYAEMWYGDRYWFPLLLDNKTFKGKLLFDENDLVISHILEVLQ